MERTWSCLEVPESSQARQSQSSAQQQPHIPWPPRAAVQRQQSRAKDQTLLQSLHHGSFKDPNKSTPKAKDGWRGQSQGCLSPKSPV